MGEPIQKVCLRCGKLVSSEDRYCISCGSDLHTPTMTGEPGAVPATTFRDHNTFPQQTPTNVPFAYPYYRLRKTDDMAVISLICALASFLVFPFIPAIAATILGFKSRDRIRKDPSGLEGEGLALAGIIIGSINIFLAVLVFILVIMLP